MSRDGRGGDDVDAVVRAELTALLTKTGRAVPALADDLKLDADLGLTSLEVTTLLVAVTARLEAAQAADVMTDVDIATVGDLRRAVRPSTPAGVHDESDTLAASRRRAEARRAAGR